MSPRNVGDRLADPRHQPVHWSDLKHMAKSPAHYLAAVRTQRKATPAMMFGTLGHAIALGGDYLVWPNDRRGKAWEEFRDANEGQSIFTQSEVDRANEAVASLRKHPKAWPLVRDAQREVPATWRFMGRECSTGGIDLLGPGPIVTELKFCPDARAEKFHWHAKSMGYLGQLAWYEPAGATILGSEIQELRIIAVEAKPPYDVVVHRLTRSAAEYGRRSVRLLMERLLVCEASNEWPGYCADEVMLDVDTEAEFVFGDEEAA